MSIENDLIEYLEKEPNLSRNDRLSYLRSILNKHFEVSNLEHVINFYDLFAIVNNAKTNMADIRLPMRVSRKQIDSCDLAHVALINAFISYLNKNNMLTKLIKFDYTE